LKSTPKWEKIPHFSPILFRYTSSSSF